MKILVTGASGLLGSSILHIKKNKFKMHGLINKRNIMIDKIKFFKINNEKNLEEIIKKEKYDVLINCVGLSDVDLCEENKKLAKITHINYVKKISNICFENKIYLIHISTDHLFDGKKKYYSELSNPEPINYYAKTKIKSEQIIKSKLKKYLIIRGNFYGWGTSYRKSFSDWIYETLSNNKKINLFTDIFFTPLYLRDFINIIFKLIQKKKNGIYNVSGSERISKYNFGIKLAKIFNLDKDLINKIKIAQHKITKRPKDMSLNSKKLLQTLNIKKNYLSINNQLKRMKIDKLPNNIYIFDDKKN